MKQICAWCGKKLSESDSSGKGISYGICLPCANAVIINIPNDLRKFLDLISIPVLLVSFEGIVKTANDKALSLLGKDASQFAGHRAGEVFECAYSRLPGGCGNTYHCSGCVIRRSILETHATGAPQVRVPATLMQHAPDHPQEVRYLVSTEKFSDYVLLKIHGDEPGPGPTLGY
ncbi:hypothetical protein GMST_27360 [Geomonas silvestris]|uniref:PAS domain-containing protein n=1 Tax=Geomonas silvestris TaxID=2740184 RepID=A0A6V8MK78_9BACT|nr:hypothetical protein [Geomonas silvestris]GFO60411.1 hypothetical protein GMST_27360 [Geomonas silvestris]